MSGAHLVALPVSREPWPLGLLVLPLAAGAWMLARALGAWQPVEASVVLLLLLPLACVPTLRRDLPREAAARAVLVCAALGLLWSVVVDLLAPGVLPTSAWRPFQRSAALALCVATAACGVSAGRLLLWQGAAAAATAIAIVTANAIAGHARAMDTSSIGLGHINLLLNTAGPSLLAWCVLVWHRRRATPPWQRWLLAAGLGAVVAAAVLTERRGVALAALSVAAFFALRALVRQRRYALLAAVAVAGAIGAAWAAWWIHEHALDPRMQRILLYRAGLDGAAAAWPMGLGDAGAMRLGELATEAARLNTAAGWGTHIHSEFLEAALCGGPLALALLLAATGLLAWRTWRVADDALRDAGLALGIAVLVHMACDNVYGSEVGELWLGGAAGILLAMPTRAAPPPGAGRPLRLACFGIALIAGCGALRALPSALVGDDASPAVHWQRLPRALNPQTAFAHAMAVLGDGTLTPTQRRRVVAVAVERVGWVPPLAFAAVEAERQAADADGLRSTLVRASRTHPLQLDLLQGLTRLPMETLEPRLRRRAELAAGLPGIAAPDLRAAAEDIESAADLHAAVAWALARGERPAEVGPALAVLVRRYGNLPELAPTLLRAMAAGDAADYAWVGEFAGMLRPHLERHQVLGEIRRAEGPGPAGALLAGLARIEPAVATGHGLSPDLGEAVAALRLRVR